MITENNDFRSLDCELANLQKEYEYLKKENILEMLKIIELRKQNTLVDKLDSSLQEISSQVQEVKWTLENEKN